MLILRSAGASPYGRKVRIAAAILGLDDRIRVEQADAGNPADTLRQQNPLGKIPTLVLEDGSTLFDSPLLLEYLDALAGGGRILPTESKARFAALRLQALCDGILDACLLQVYEGRWRAAEHHDAKWMAYQADKVARGLAVLEAEPPVMGATPDVGHITLACTLGYLDLRFGGRWRDTHPKLVAWLDVFAARESAFETTKVAA
jgi:glutathione S-transferase